MCRRTRKATRRIKNQKEEREANWTEERVGRGVDEWEGGNQETGTNKRRKEQWKKYREQSIHNLSFWK